MYVIYMSCNFEKRETVNNDRLFRGRDRSIKSSQENVKNYWKPRY